LTITPLISVAERSSCSSAVSRWPRSRGGIAGHCTFRRPASARPARHFAYGTSALRNAQAWAGLAGLGFFRPAAWIALPIGSK